MFKKSFIAAVSLAALLALGGCAQQAPEEEGPDYADDEAMALIADGLEARSDVAEQQILDGTTGTNASYQEAVQTELDIVSPLRDRQFEDSELQERVLAYINILNDSLDVVANYPVSDANFLLKWAEVYDERTALINGFVTDYGLALDAEHQSVLDEMSANGAAAIQQDAVDEAVGSMVESLVFEKQSDGYGYFTYVSTAQNTSGYSLENVSIVLSLYDAEGVKVKEAYVNTTSWAVNETVRFEGFGDVDAVQIKPTLQYYTVVE